ncbi:peptidylprolyl isomerase [Spirosoma sp. SC4-14]|uniref:peptidylprolyl isomerase n=1 Tax=Spirosoma sp. SC4-14 TaxID=3128900 RepID=UPI0030CFABBA
MRQLTGGILLALAVTACKTSAPVVQQTPPQPVILTLGSKTFSTDDFFQSFTKNQFSSDSTQHTDVKDYLDLYTNLKLKVLDAEAEGRDTTEAFREEINTYRKQLAQSYLTDKVLVESMAAEAYQHMQEEINVSHILVSVVQDAAPADTLAAYQKALAIRKQALAGTDFAKLAQDNSQDVQTASKGGNLGYITAFSLIYPLETAAYATPVGQISQPIRTRFGYHLLQVNDRRPGRGKIRVAHLLVRLSPGADETGQKAAKDRIDAAYARLQKGDLFETVCKEVSDDVTSRNNGGLLPLFGVDRQVPAFEQAAYALTKPGELSKPVQTNYGWHIIKLIERKGLEPYADLAPSLRQRVTTDTRAEVLRQSTVQRLRKDYPIQEDKSVVATALAKADSSLLRGKWRFSEPLEADLDNKTIATIGGKPISVNQFFAYVRLKQQPQRNPALADAEPTQPIVGSPAVAMRRLFDRFIGDQLISTEEDNLDKKSPEFRALLSEIREGVLLSQVMEENVWERSMTDSTGQRQYFEQHKDQYRFPERAVATIVVAQNEDQLKQAREMLAGRPPYQLRRSAPDLSFDQNQTMLTPKLRERLFEVVATLASNPAYVVEVSGSHDATERDSISAGRIRAVVNYLLKNGITLNRIAEKDYQGVPPRRTTDAPKDPAVQRRISFQYFSNAKTDIARVLNNSYGQADTEAAVTVLDGIFAEGDNAILDGISEWKEGTTTFNRDSKSVMVSISRIEPARAKTFAEARGSVINDYQGVLEKQWLAQLRQKYPVKVNDDEIRKLTK